MSHHLRNRPLHRRTLLKGLGVALALPFLDAMAPRLYAADPAKTTAMPRRMLCIETNQGILPQHFFPAQAGQAYTLTPYLEILKDFRERMTVFSGVSLPEVDGGEGSGGRLTAVLALRYRIPEDQAPVALVCNHAEAPGRWAAPEAWTAWD